MKMARTLKSKMRKSIAKRQAFNSWTLEESNLYNAVGLEYIHNTYTKGSDQLQVLLGHDKSGSIRGGMFSGVIKNRVVFIDLATVAEMFNNNIQGYYDVKTKQYYLNIGQFNFTSDTEALSAEKFVKHFIENRKKVA